MENKKKLGFLSLLLAGVLVMGACTQKRTTPSGSQESTQPDSSQVESQGDESQPGSETPSEPVEPSEPSVPVEPSEPSEPSIPVEPSEPSEPSIPVEPSEPSEPSEPVEPSESEEPTPSESEEQKFTVTFKVDGVTIDTKQVPEGQTVTAPADPSKEPDAEAVKYRFKGWDKDLSQPITADLEVNAIFAAYAAEIMIDDFESYDDSATMQDAGWVTRSWSNTLNDWDDNIGNTAVNLSSNARGGNKALRFDSWQNGTGYKFVRKITDDDDMSKSANALKFSLMAPRIKTGGMKKATLLINLKAMELENPISHQKETYLPVVKYTLDLPTSEYVDYTIPLNDTGLKLWGEDGKSIVEVAAWTGIHQDDIAPYISEIEFYLEGDNGGKEYSAFVDDIKLVTEDNPEKTAVEKMGQYTRYTGLLNDGHTVKIELGAAGAATATVVDMETPVQIPGNVTLEGKRMTFTSANDGATLVYAGDLVDGGQLIKFASGSGAFAAAVQGVNLNAVQTVENFDQYTTDGQAYYQGNLDKDQRSGARGAYYSEYYSGGGTPADFGGSGWNLLGGDGSQLKLKQDGGHSGNNYLCLKNGKGFTMRYMSWGSFDGTAEKNSYRGTTFSFWAKTNGKVPKIKVMAFSKIKPTAGDVYNNGAAVGDPRYMATETFEETAAVATWKHYELALSPDRVYYGFMVSLASNGIADSYLYIDDVEIYTANPYKTYVAPEPPVEISIPVGTVYTAAIAGLVNAQLTFISGSNINLNAAGAGMDINGTYALNEDEITLTLGGDTYVAAVAEDISTLTFKSVSGEGAVAQYLNGVNFNRVHIAEDVEYAEQGTMWYQNNSEASASGARGAYFCDYYSGGSGSPVGGSGWSLMGGSGDQLRLDTTTGFGPTSSQSLKIKRSGSTMRFIQWDLYKGTAKAINGANKFTVFFKGDSAKDVEIKINVYTASQITPTNHTTALKQEVVTVQAGTDWRPYTVELNPNTTYYGFGFVTVGKSSGEGAGEAWVNFDLAYFSYTNNDPDLLYYGKTNMVFNGTITPGAASMKIGAKNAVYFTCENAGANNVEGSYRMERTGENTQQIIIKVANTTITADYAVNIATGQVTITVTAVTGDLAAAIAVDTVFSNM